MRICLYSLHLETTEITWNWCLYKLRHVGLVVRKPVFGISNKASFKPVSSATETSYKIEILPVTRINMALSKKQITKMLIRLRGWAGWSAPVLFSNPRRQVFSRRGPCDFQQCGTLTWIDLDQPVQPPVRVENSKCCSFNSLTVIEYLSDYQRLWSVCRLCAYAQACLSLYWSHIPHCWKSHVTAQCVSFCWAAI